MFPTTRYRHHAGAPWLPASDFQEAIFRVDSRQGGRVEERDAEGRLTRRHPARRDYSCSAAAARISASRSRRLTPSRTARSFSFRWTSGGRGIFTTTGFSGSGIGVSPLISITPSIEASYGEVDG